MMELQSMRMTTKSRFAVSAMIDLALREQQGPVSLTDICERHKISLSYLEQIFSKLRQQGLVESTRGPGGGYSLSRPASTISVADIIDTVDDLSEQKYLGADQQDDVSKADMTQDLWETLNSKMMTYMQSITLRSLADDQQAKSVVNRKSP
jgi:Rrf2 family iron-sulfur cluster assembly transcriptional regulator